MAPEYSSEGLFSPKSDVFSFGVIILEIISGKRNASLDQCEDFINLLGYVSSWTHVKCVDCFVYLVSYLYLSVEILLK